MRQLQKISRKRDRDRRHSTGLNDEQQDPAVNERHRRMQCLAQIRILSAHDRQPHRQFRVDESADERDQSAGDPRAQDQRGSMDAFRDDVGIDENPRADDPAHHRHGRSEQAELATESSALHACASESSVDFIEGMVETANRGVHCGQGVSLPAGIPCKKRTT